MAHQKIIIVSLLLLLGAFGGFAQQTCYQIGVNEGRQLYEEGQRLERNGRCVDAVPKFWEALERFRLTRSCRDLPASHELDTWEDRCTQSITACGGKNDKSTYMIVAPRSLSFAEKGGAFQIAVNTNADAWKVDKNPSWCTIQRSANRVTVTCKENAETTQRNDRLVIVAGSLTCEVSIRQEGQTFTEIPDYERLKITDVKFAAKYADDLYGNYGEALYNHLSFLFPRISFDNLSVDSSSVKLDFKIFDSQGLLLALMDSEYTYSTKINLQGNNQPNEIIDVQEWGADSVAIFATPGEYKFVIECSGVNLFSTPFEILPQPTPQDDPIELPEDPIPLEKEKQDTIPPPRTPSSPSSPAHSALSFGLKAGLNLATITNNDSNLDFEPSMKLDFHVGAFINLNFGARDQKPGFFGLQSEVLYSRQGFSFGGEKVNFDYISIPLMVKMHVYEGLYIDVGPYISFLLSVNPDETVIFKNTIQLSDLKGGKDVGAAFGVIYEDRLGWIVGARFQHGISNMANNLSWMNQVLSLSVGWKF